jgi:hypothetical protein
VGREVAGLPVGLKRGNLRGLAEGELLVPFIVGIVLDAARGLDDDKAVGRAVFCGALGLPLRDVEECASPSPPGVLLVEEGVVGFFPRGCFSLGERVGVR